MYYIEKNKRLISFILLFLLCINSFGFKVLAEDSPSPDTIAPVLNFVSIESNNINNQFAAKVGDTITVSIVSNEVLASSPAIKIDGKDAAVSGNGTNWAGTYKMTDLDTGCQVSFAIDYADIAANPGETVTTTTDLSSVKFYHNKPTINLNDLTEITIQINDSYEDPVTAKDELNGDLTAQIIKGGVVNIALSGIYEVTYNVKDAADNEAEPVTKVVHVVDTPANSAPSKPGSFSSLSGQSYNGGDDITLSWGVSTDPEEDAVSYVLEFSLCEDDWKQIYSGNSTTYTYNDTEGENSTTAQFRVKAKDTQDLYSEYAISDVFTINTTLLTLDPVSIVSNNDNIYAAKVGDIVTVSIISNEVLAARPVITIAEKDVTAEGSGKSWTGSYTMTMADTPGQVSFSVNIAGNPGAAVSAATDGKSVTFYPDKPIIKLNSPSEIMIKATDSYTDPATAADVLNANLTSEIVKAGEVNTVTAGVYVVKYNVSDAAGNNADEVTKTVHVQPKASDSTKSDIVGSIPAAFSAGEFLLTGDTLSSIKITAIPVHGKLTYKDADINVAQGTEIDASELNSLVFIADNDFSGDDTFKWTGKGSESMESNEATATLSIKVNSPPPKPNSFLLPLSGQSYKGGGSITVKWDASIDPEGSSVSYTLEFSPDGTNWQKVDDVSNTSYTYNASAELNTATAKFRIIAVDAENYKSEYTTSDAFTIDSTVPELNTVSIVSDNKTSSLAKVGDEITVSITSLEDLASKPAIKIAGNSAFVSGDKKAWTGVYRMTKDDLEGPVSITVDYTDIVGNTGAQKTATMDDSVVIFDKTNPVITLDAQVVTIPIGSEYIDKTTASDNLDGILTGSIVKSGSEVKPGVVGTYSVTYNVTDAAGNKAEPFTKTICVQPIASNSTKSGIVGNIQEGFSAGEFAVTGDTVTSIKITHLPLNGQLKLNGVEVNENQVIPISELDKLNYRTDNSFAEDAVTKSDSFKWAGIGAGQVYSNEAAMSLTIDKNKPPTNPESITLTPDAQRYKEGQIELSWEASTDSDGNASAIAYTLEFFSGTDWNVIYTGVSTSNSFSVTSQMNIDNAGFRVKATDQGGVDSVYTESAFFIIDNKAPTLSSVKIKSSSNTSFAKIGDTITIEFTSSEVLNGTPVVKIGEKDASVTTEDHLTWRAQYTMTGSDNEGIIQFSIDFVDLTGIPGIKTTVTGDSSQIVFDRTIPVISLNGPSEVPIEVKTSYADAGATATEGLTDKITVSSTVAVNVVGVYIVTYNVTDAAGNTAVEVVRTVRVGDTTKPVIVLNGPSETKIEVRSTYTDAGATASDNYDGNLTGSIVVNDFVDEDIVHTYTITYDVTDDNGNVADEVTRIVHVVDTTIPVITITPVDGNVDLTIEVDSSYTDAGAMATDNYDSAEDITANIISSGSVNTKVVGVYTINYDVTDVNGNKAKQEIRTVHVVDTQAPVITLKGSDKVILKVHTPYNDEGATALDNYDGDLTGKIVVNNTVKANVVGTYTVTYDVNDSSGNSAAQVKRTVIVQDKTPPIITLKGVTQDGISDVTVQVHIGVYNSDIAKTSATATDNYDGDLSNKIVVNNPVNVDFVDDYAVTFDVTDANGNAAVTVTRTVHVVDTQNPQILLNGSNNEKVQLGTAYTDAGAVVKDNYDLDRPIVGAGSVNTAVVGNYTLSFTAADGNGNAANPVYRTVRVVDEIPPVIILNEADEGTTDYTMEVHESYVEPDFTVTDNYDVNLHGKVVISNPVIVDKIGDYTVTYNIMDSSGNSAIQVIRTVHVVDSTPPVITLKGNNIATGKTDVWVEAKTSYTEPGYTATDNYYGNLTSDVDVSGTVDVTALDDYTLYYDVTDSSKNKAVQVTRTAHVVDTIKPSLKLIGASAISIANGGAYTDEGVDAEDNFNDTPYLNSHLVISINGVVTSSPVTLTTPGTYVLIYNVSDSSGNAAKSIRRTVYVNGTGGPGPQITVVSSEDTIEVKTDYNVKSGVITAIDRGGVDITGLITAAVKDPNAADVTGSITSDIINFKLVGDYIITYHVTEPIYGGSDSEIRVIHVVDTTKPVLHRIGDEVVEVDVHTSYIDQGATATDNYDDSGLLTSRIFVKNSVVINQVGEYKVTYNVADSNGKAADEIERIVKVLDRTKPVITLLGPSVITLQAKNSTYTEHGAVATDNYDRSCTVVIIGSVDTNTVGVYKLTYSAIDVSKNEAVQVNRTINIVDTIGPVITLNNPEDSNSPDVTLEVHNDYSDPGATAFDRYDNASIVVGPPDISNFKKDVLGYYHVTYTATDSHANSATKNRSVYVVDTTKPVITLNGSANVILEVHTNYTDDKATAWDNYDSDLTGKIFVVNPVISDKVGIYEVTYTVSDANGNTATAKRIVNIVDTTPPVITIIGPSVLTIPVGSGYSDAGATASDNYDGDITSRVTSTGTVDTSHVGKYEMAYNVSDAHDKAAITKIRTVYVQPTAANISKPGVQNVQMKFISDEFSSKLSGDTLSRIKIVTLPSNGTLINDDATVNAGDAFDSSTIGNLVYIPNGGRVGKDSFNWSAVGAAGIWSNNAAVNFDIAPNIPPTTPGIFTGFTAGEAFKGSSSITIGWGLSTDPDGNLGNPIKYVLEFSKDGGVTWSELEVVTDTSYTYTLPTENTASAKFRVKARDAGNNDSNYQTSSAFTIDSKAPALTVVKISSNNNKPNYAKVDDIVTVTLTASEPLRTKPVVIIAGHDANVTGSETSWTGKYKLTSTDLEGEITFTINYSDLVGNQGDAVSTVMDESKVIFDMSKPVIVLTGSSPLTMPYGSTYSDAGATAGDNIDGNITVSIFKTSTVTNSVGTYTVTYNVKDNAGNSADTVTRTVIVQPKASDGTKSGVENIASVFTLDEFASKYANDTLSSVTITVLPVNGTLKYNGAAVTGSTEIPIGDISTGKLVFVPNTGFHDTDSFKWTAVGSKDIHSTEAIMSLNIKANIPPTIPGAITGVSAGQKVKGGSTVTLSWGASEDSDNGGVPLQYILDSSTDGNTWTGIYFGTLLASSYSIPVIDVTTAQFRVKAKDAGGFESLYKNSAIYTIDSTPPVLTKVHIASNNTNTALAKAADQITVSFEADEELSSLPKVTIAGTNATVTDSGKTWTATYIMGIGDGEGPVNFTVDFKDVAGNSGSQASSTKDSSTVIFDRTKPILSLTGEPSVTTPFGIPYNDAGAKASDSREGDISSSVTAVSTVDTVNVGHYKVTYNVKDGAGNSAVSIFRDVDVQPRADNGLVTALENIPYGFQVNDFQPCFKGDTANGTKITSVPLHGTLKNGTSVVENDDDIASIINLTYIPNIGYYGNDSFGWNGMGTKGIRSTDAVMTVQIQQNFPPSTPGAFTGITQGQSVKGGTTVKAEFGASTDSDGDRGISMRYVLEYSSDGNSWVQVYTGTDTSYNHNPGSINTDKAQYRVKALDGGNLLSDYTNSNIFAIDSSAPVLSPVSSTSNNNTHSLGKSGDEITLNFTANESLKESPVVKIAENAADVTGSEKAWAAKYTMTDSDTEGQIPFSIEFEDLLGNKGATVTGTTDGSKVIYDRTKPVITITGSDENVEVYSTYVDRGAAASDNFDTGVTGKIIASGTVNMDVLGDYQITYNVSDAAGNIADQKVRTVKVKDMTKPVITLKGSSEVTIAVHSVYTDLGAAANDNYDSSEAITKNIKVLNSVKTDVIGDYTVTYDVEDAHGNIAIKVTRTVHVIDDKIQLHGKITEQDTGKVIPNAKVSLYDLSNALKHGTVADINGDYAIDNVVLGQYKLVVENPKYSTKTIGIKLLAEDVTASKIREDVELVNFVITLTSNPNSIIGDGVQTATFDALIVDKDNKPIPQITVKFSAEMGTFPDKDTATTGLDGRCSVVYKSENIGGTESKRISVKAEVNDTAKDLHASNEIVITYEPSVIKGVVVDNDTKKKVKGAVVEVSKDFNGDGIVDFYARFITGDNGEYVIAVPRGKVDYEIKITKLVQVNGTTKDMTFSQTCNVIDSAGAGNENNSTNTIAGLLLYKQPDGTVKQLDDYSQYEIKVTEKQNGADIIPGTFDSKDEKGVFQAEGLQNGKTYTVAVIYDMGGGIKIKVGDAEVSVSSDGQIGISTILIDPYGTITDVATGSVISGAQVALKYAKSARNIAAGKEPDSEVALPGILGFEPNDNANPQISDSLGQYAFMVFPNMDYYIKASKAGYQDYTSPTISVEDKIVQWNFKMSQLSGSGGSVIVTPPVYESAGVGRIAGDTRIDTAIEIAKATFKDRVKNVVIARSDIFADALSGSVLSYKYDAPILLVGQSESDLQKVLTYMKNTLDVDGNVFILGEYGAVSTYVEQRIKESFKGVKRIGGADRYETSAKIAEYLNVPKGTPVVFASGEDFPDALSVSGAAAARQYPILLVQKDEVPDAIKKKIIDIKPAKVFIIGLQGAVSKGDEEQILEVTALDKSNVVRIGGIDRYETSIETAKYFDMEGSSVGIATGIDFPDALASSIFGAKLSTPILLVDEKLSESTIQYLKDKKLTGIVIFGGTGAVSEYLEEQLTKVIIK